MLRVDIYVGRFHIIKKRENFRRMRINRRTVDRDQGRSE